MNQTPYQRLMSLGVDDQIISLVLGFISVTSDRYFGIIYDMGKLFLSCKYASMATSYLLLYHFCIYHCLLLRLLNCYVTLLCCVWVTVGGGGAGRQSVGCLKRQTGGHGSLNPLRSV
jgi:hypothetical protein